jgi:hypothetical protein
MGRPRRGGVRGEDGDDVRLLDALEQKVDFDVGVALVSVIYFGSLAEEGIGFLEKKNEALISAKLKILSRFLSVSPVNLLTTAARSI